MPRNPRVKGTPGGNVVSSIQSFETEEKAQDVKTKRASMEILDNHNT